MSITINITLASLLMPLIIAFLSAGARWLAQKAKASDFLSFFVGIFVALLLLAVLVVK